MVGDAAGRAPHHMATPPALMIPGSQADHSSRHMEAYDSIGIGYAKHRQPDARIARAMRAALGEGKSLVNVGAGTGSYEPDDMAVTAVELGFAGIE